MNSGNVVLNCRTCTRACKDYKSLYEGSIVNGELTTLADLLQYCTNMSFHDEDSSIMSMPMHICLSCISLLEQSYAFKRMVIESDELLRQGLRATSGDFMVVEMLNDDTNTSSIIPEDICKTEEIESCATMSEVDIEYVDQIEIDGNGNIEKIELDPSSCVEQIDGIEMGPNDIEIHDNIEYIDIKHEMYDYVGDSDEQQQYEIIEEEQHLDDDDDDDVVIEEHMFQENMESYDIEVEEDADVDGDGIDIDEEFSIEQGEITLLENEELDEYDYESNTTTRTSDALANVCDVCGKGFRVLCRLRQHMLSHNEKKLFTCEVCGKKLKHLKNYKDHMITHTDLKPHQCDVCNRFYRTTSSLAAHKRTHAEDKPFKCDTCGRGFAAFDHMTRHKLTHTGERPYQCNLCDKAYYDSSSLRTHLTSHTGIKAYTCEICGIGLTQKSGYKKHLLVHSGEKPHKCPICGRCFTFTSNLNAHVRLHSGEKPFKCEKCPKCFPTKKRLQSHQRVHNKDTVVSPTTFDAIANFERRSAMLKDGHKPNSLPDMPDHQVSRSKVVVVL